VAEWRESNYNSDYPVKIALKKKRVGGKKKEK
jgi:hypothetical protein